MPSPHRFPLEVLGQLKDLFPTTAVTVDILYDGLLHLSKGNLPKRGVLGLDLWVQAVFLALLTPAGCGRAPGGQCGSSIPIAKSMLM